MAEIKAHVEPGWLPDQLVFITPRPPELPPPFVMKGLPGILKFSYDQIKPFNGRDVLVDFEAGTIRAA